MSALNRAIRGAMCLLLAATLAGWGNSEADQRKAFIAFLQDLNKPRRRACAGAERQ